MSFCLNRRQRELLALSLLAALTAGVAGQDKASSKDQQPTLAKGEIVTELDKAIWRVFQAKNGDYWFGTPERGAYRYDGKALVNFTTMDGLASNNIEGFQEDKAGNVYVTTDGVSKFDGKTFTNLPVAADAVKTDWKLRPDDLWFRGPTNSGMVYRYDGQALHPLALPTTKEGDEHYAQVPRDQFPNAKYSPYDVYVIFKDSKGHVWFGTAMLGVCRYDGQSFLWIPESELRNGSFGTRSIVEDKEGKFWFCKTQRYAVDLSDPARPSFRKGEGIREAGDLNRAPCIMSSVVDNTGALWMATFGNGVYRYDGKSLTHYPVKDGTEDATLYTISKDNQGVLWLGTHKAGAYKFDGKAFAKFRL